ncbi:MAG: HepT-like ribonuclease domain-containing protein [Cyanobacteriota bacterium]|nr:HepT-like ribonuclease domain-containing protein [Cyanobacteriota bacterium]
MTDQYLNSKTQADFERDRLLQDAIVRRLEIVGEAATRLSDEARQTLEHIPWRQIIGMRNIMIHQYDRVDLQLVRDTATQVLPQLDRDLTPYLEG